MWHMSDLHMVTGVSQKNTKSPLSNLPSPSHCQPLLATSRRPKLSITAQYKCHRLRTKTIINPKFNYKKIQDIYKEFHYLF
jgi:hypothetical protein